MQDGTIGDGHHVSALIHALSSTLTNIDFEYQSEVQRLQASRVEGTSRAVIAQTLWERHRQRREPYVRHLSELRRRAREASSGPERDRAN